MVRPRPRDYKSHSKRVKAKRTQAWSASEKCANRMVEREAKKRPALLFTKLAKLSLYDILALVVSW